MKLFDTHAHYNVEKCINVGYTLESSIKAIEIANKYNYIFATCGIHPSEIPQTENELWKEIEKIKELAIKNKKVVAIGEIGLDYYWRKDNKEMQKKALKANRTCKRAKTSSINSYKRFNR